MCNKSVDLIMIKEQVADTVSKVSAGVGSSSGVMFYLNENAGIISIGLGILSLLVTIIFSYLTHKSRQEANEINKKKSILEQKARDEIRQNEKLKTDLEIEKLKAELSAIKDN